MSNHIQPQKLAAVSWPARWVSGFSLAIRTVETSLSPILALVIRLWLAQIFFVSAILKLANWANALDLSRYEYPVSWLDPNTAAYLGVTIEFLGAIMLATGLATRLAALALLILSVVIQLNYKVLDVHLFWAVLLGWLVVRGAGPLSLDHMLKRGLADSALPFSTIMVRCYKWLSQQGATIYLCLLRLWIATAFAATAWQLVGFGRWLPSQTTVIFAGGIGLFCVVLLALGTATRPIALVLLLFTLAMQMIDPRLSVDIYWMMLFALLVTNGSGAWSGDRFIRNRLARVYPQLDGKPAFALGGLPRVVIVGAGFGGLSCAVKLANTPVSITLIDRHNYHLFQPLLYQVATTALSPGDIATPIRGVFRDQFNVRVLLGTVTSVDQDQQQVLLGDRRVPYDYLVLATGATHSYFGRDEWGAYAPGLKRVEDATEVRRRMLLAFEQAEATEDESERASLLTFLIVGGGPTGVELAGAIAELARFGMEKEFRSFDPASARVILVQAGPRILPTFPERLSAVTKRSLEKLGVEVRVNSRVEKIDQAGVMINGERIAARTVLWAAGVVASLAAKWLGVDADVAGRVKVDTDLSAPGTKNIFFIGDTSLANAWRGNAVPGLAPAAKQGGVYVAKQISSRVLGRATPAPFKYTHLGSLATIGRKAAVADFGWLRLSGAPAWWLWGLIHIGFLVGVRNRVSVMFDWFWAYLTSRSATRLITGNTEIAISGEIILTEKSMFAATNSLADRGIIPPTNTLPAML